MKARGKDHNWEHGYNTCVHEAGHWEEFSKADSHSSYYKKTKCSDFPKQKALLPFGKVKCSIIKTLSEVIDVKTMAPSLRSLLPGWGNTQGLIWNNQRIVFYNSILNMHKWIMYKSLNARDRTDTAVKINWMDLGRHPGRGEVLTHLDERVQIGTCFHVQLTGSRSSNNFFKTLIFPPSFVLLLPAWFFINQLMLWILV